jgi:hypothetical protein
LEETANQNQGVVPGEISQFNTLCTFWSYKKKCKQITPSHLKMTYIFLEMTLNNLQKPQFRGYGRRWNILSEKWAEIANGTEGAGPNEVQFSIFAQFSGTLRNMNKLPTSLANYIQEHSWSHSFEVMAKELIV